MSTPEFERRRRETIAHNNQRLRALGVLDAVEKLKALKPVKRSRNKTPFVQPCLRVQPSRAARPMSLAEPDSERVAPTPKRQKTATADPEVSVTCMKSFLSQLCEYTAADIELPGLLDKAVQRCQACGLTWSAVSAMVDRKDTDIEATLTECLTLNGTLTRRGRRWAS